jgi:hypothetical protein
MVKMFHKKEYKALAEMLFKYNHYPLIKEMVDLTFIPFFKKDNPLFNADKFKKAIYEGDN